MGERGRKLTRTSSRSADRARLAPTNRCHPVQRSDRGRRRDSVRPRLPAEPGGDRVQARRQPISKRAEPQLAQMPEPGVSAPVRENAHTPSDFRAPTLSIECELCGRFGRYNIARLMEQYGDAKLPELLYVLADCPKASPRFAGRGSRTWPLQPLSLSLGVPILSHQFETCQGS
jgi:hypothetical protein